MNERCNATLTTATDGPCPGSREDRGMACPHAGCIMVDGEWKHTMLHTLTCSRDAAHNDRQSLALVDHESYDGAVVWDDTAEGAKPHEPSLVTDAEVEAALDALIGYAANTGPVGQGRFNGSWSEAARLALEAAAKVREEGA